MTAARALCASASITTARAQFAAPRRKTQRARPSAPWQVTARFNVAQQACACRDPPDCGASQTPNSNKCARTLCAISTKLEIISITRLVTPENSSDLSSGRRPVSKSDEFLVILIVLSEIMRCEHGTFPIHGHTYWDFESAR